MTNVRSWVPEDWPPEWSYFDYRGGGWAAAASASAAAVPAVAHFVGPAQPEAGYHPGGLDNRPTAILPVWLPAHPSHEGEPVVYVITAVGVEVVLLVLAVAAWSQLRRRFRGLVHRGRLVALPRGP